MQTLFFKRSFITVRAGLREADPAVVEQAAKAVESLYFQHAFDPLSRIVRESPQPHVRASAIRALARVDTIEAAEFLLGILDHGAPADRAAALAGLEKSRGGRFIELAKSSMATSGPELRAALGELLRRRGVAA
jgi:HEAT repeat protein